MNDDWDPKGDDTNYNQNDDDLKHEIAKPPSVLGEEDPFSGDATSSESPDIDEELEKVGLKGDSEEEDPSPLGLSEELAEEEV